MISNNLSILKGFLEEFRGQEVLFHPNPGNAGDSLIAAATYQALRRAGIRYRCIDTAYDVTGRTVLLGGGGSLVPLYKEMRDAIEVFHGVASRLVILPHTIRGNEDLLRRLDSSTTIFCRDPDSYLHALNNTGATVYIDHDMAFHLDIEEFYNSCRPYKEVPQVFENKMAVIPSFRDAGFDHAHFLREDGERRIDRNAGVNDLDISKAFEFGVLPDNAEKSVWCMFEAINRSRTVTTDRLHVGIACALLNRECTLLDNSYGKNRSVYLHSIRRFSDVVRLQS
jgi:exopolysaccharide biosynthesis predicted pyruvyltransferase EpsI